MGQDEPENKGLTLRGSIQTDMLVSENDKQTGAMKANGDFLNNTYVELGASLKNIDVGLRLEYLQYPLPGFEPDFKGWGVPHYYIKWQTKRMELTAGTFYEQFGSGFVAVNPNSKIPALVDRSGDSPVNVFESGAILMYLAEKFGRFLPASGAARAECLSWLFWQVGSGPYLGGGFGHFYAYAPEKFEYPINRFAMETKRQLDLLDRHLASREFICESGYSVADMAIWPWYGRLVLGELYGAAEFLDVASYKNVQRWTKQLAERPGVQRGKDAQHRPLK